MRILWAAVVLSVTASACATPEAVRAPLRWLREPPPEVVAPADPVAALNAAALEGARSRANAAANAAAEHGDGAMGQGNETFGEGPHALPDLANLANQNGGNTAALGAASNLGGEANSRRGPPVRSVAFALHLASYDTDAEAKRGWRLLSATVGDVLRPLRPRTEQVTVNGQVYQRLKAGPLRTADDARAACATLQAAGLYCRLTDFSGWELTL